MQTVTLPAHSKNLLRLYPAPPLYRLIGKRNPASFTSGDGLLVEVTVKWKLGHHSARHAVAALGICRADWYIQHEKVRFKAGDLTIITDDMIQFIIIWMAGWGAGVTFPADTCTAAWYSKRYPPVVIQQCNTAAQVEGLTAIEKEVVLLTNLVRYDPALFAQNVLRTFIQECVRSLLLYSSTTAV